MSSSRKSTATRRTALGALAAASLIPSTAVEAAAPDDGPAYAAIERHRELSAAYDAASAISGKLPDGPEFEAADAITCEKRHALITCVNELIRIQPRTLAGVTALVRYVADLEDWQVPYDENWQKVFLTTLANGLDTIHEHDFSV